MQGEPPQDGLTLRPQLDDDSSSIPSVPAASHHPSPREAIDKLHDAVMTDLQALGQDSDRRRPTALQPLELQKNVILLRLHSGGAGRHLADTQELSNPIPQLGESRVVDDTVSVATPACPNHYGIIS